MKFVEIKSELVFLTDSVSGSQCVLVLVTWLVAPQMTIATQQAAKAFQISTAQNQPFE